MKNTFDLRNVIAALIGLYGVVLVVCSFVLDPGIDPDTGQPKDAMDNLWAGVAMVIAAGIFWAWAKLRPVTAEPESEA